MTARHQFSLSKHHCTSSAGLTPTSAPRSVLPSHDQPLMDRPRNAGRDLSGPQRTRSTAHGAHTATQAEAHRESGTHCAYHIDIGLCTAAAEVIRLADPSLLEYKSYTAAMIPTYSQSRILRYHRKLAKACPRAHSRSPMGSASPGTGKAPFEQLLIVTGNP